MRNEDTCGEHKIGTYEGGEAEFSGAESTLRRAESVCRPSDFHPALNGSIEMGSVKSRAL